MASGRDDVGWTFGEGKSTPQDASNPTMSSRKRIAANRRNARKSTGPRTEEGKARSSRNATTHGLTAQVATSFAPIQVGAPGPAVPGAVATDARFLPDEFGERLRLWVDDLQPVGI